MSLTSAKENQHLNHNCLHAPTYMKIIRTQTKKSKDFLIAMNKLTKQNLQHSSPSGWAKSKILWEIRQSLLKILSRLWVNSRRN